MGLRPKVACKPHAPDAEQLCKHWQRPGALLPRKCAALFLISNRLTARSEEHTSELQSQSNLVCRLLLEKKKSIRYLFGTSPPRSLTFSYSATTSRDTMSWLS